MTQNMYHVATFKFQNMYYCTEVIRRLQLLYMDMRKRLKVSYFQNEFMKLSFLHKYEQKIVSISALCSEGRNPENSLFLFWEKR